jgi:hypothetical protein
MFIISFPRSGQHLLERLLIEIYKYYNKDFSYCEFYNCCNTVPCYKNCIFQKNHDFNLDLKIPLDDKLIILYRKDKIIQLESYFRLVYLTKEIYDVKLDYNSDLLETAIEFINNNSEYYDRFIDKYVDSNKYTNALIIEYDSIINDTSQYIKNLIEYLNLHENNDIKLDEIVNYIINNFEKIEYKNTLSDEIYDKINHSLNN